MTIPKYHEMQRPILEALKDGNEHSVRDIVEFTARHFQLTEEDMAKMYQSGNGRVVSNRASWACSYLKNAGLIENTARAMYRITESGQEVLKNGPRVIDKKYLLQFKGSVNSRNVLSVEESATPYPEPDYDENKTPDEAMEEAFGELNLRLASDILSEVAKLSPQAFKQMAIDLFHKMGYGVFEDAGSVTSPSHDDGIDGIIMEDRLGFSLVYIQAKKWDAESTVDQSEMQKFVGAIADRDGKGLFITTAKFAQNAMEYAERRHIILIDGAKLARLMIEYNFGARVNQVYEIKSVDTDVFSVYTGE